MKKTIKNIKAAIKNGKAVELNSTGGLYLEIFPIYEFGELKREQYVLFSKEGKNFVVERDYLYDKENKRLTRIKPSEGMKIQNYGLCDFKDTQRYLWNYLISAIIRNHQNTSDFSWKAFENEELLTEWSKEERKDFDTLSVYSPLKKPWEKADIISLSTGEVYGTYLPKRTKHIVPLIPNGKISLSTRD